MAVAVQASPVVLPNSSAHFQPASWEEDEDGQSRQPDLRQHISRTSLSDLGSTYGAGQTSQERARISLLPELVPEPEPKQDGF